MRYVISENKTIKEILQEIQEKEIRTYYIIETDEKGLEEFQKNPEKFELKKNKGKIEFKKK